MDRTVSRITSGLRTATQSRCSHSRLFSWPTSLGPNTSKRSVASSSVKPAGEVFSRWKTSEISLVAASLTKSAARWPFEFFMADMLWKMLDGVSFQNGEQGTQFAASLGLAGGVFDALMQ